MALDGQMEPVGLQRLFDPRLSRRQLIAGIVATPLAAETALAAGDPPETWTEVRFDLSKDERSLTIVEVGVTKKKDETPTRRDVCCWRLPADAFGPAARFDRTRPEGDASKGGALLRRVIVRGVSYGLIEKGRIDFELKREAKANAPWSVAFSTDLWTPGKAITSACVPLSQLVGGPRDKAGLGVAVPAAEIQTKLKAAFDGLIEADVSSSKTLQVVLDRSLIWTVSGAGGACAVKAFDGAVKLKSLTLGWRRSKDEAEAFFAGVAEPGAFVGCPDLVLGDGKALAVRLKQEDHGKANWPRLVTRIGASPTDPGSRQTVVSVDVGAGELLIEQAGETLAGEIGARALKLTRTVMPAKADGAKAGKTSTTKARTVRTVLWGSAMQTPPPTPVPSKDGKPATPPDSKSNRLPVREIVSPVGRLLIGAASIELTAEAPGEPEVPPADLGCDCSDVAKAAADEAVQITEGRSAAARRSGKQKKSAAERLFQIACGDQGGAVATTIFAVHDSAGPKDAPTGMRRIMIDLSLHAASFAPPDTSFSRLTFAAGDMRLVYEDGKPFPELTAGEHPRMRPSSFIWLSEAATAEFDLSSATLTCARDYDLMKLSFEFQDLTLSVGNTLSIRPAREDCRLMERDGVFFDSRPILVAAFDPQHVLEQAVFRPEPPPLPDVELKSWAGLPDIPAGMTLKRAIVAKLGELGAAGERKELRRLVADAMQDAEAKSGARAPFKTFRDAFEKEARRQKLPVDQTVYIGPIALDPDAMSLARKLQKSVLKDDVGRAIDTVLKRVDGLAASDDKGVSRIDQKGRYPSKKFGAAETLSDEQYLDNALFKERLLSQSEPIYGLFRDHYRDEMTACWSAAQPGAPKPEKKFEFEPPSSLDSHEVEFVVESNWPTAFETRNAMLTKRRQAVFETFLSLAIGTDDVPDLVEARLSGPSRLAFRINCSPLAGLSAEQAGLPATTGNGPDRPGPGAIGFEPIPFTFEALTDWSRHEPAVTRRAQKRFTALDSGLIPPLGNRAANVGDEDVLEFQGFPSLKVTAAERIQKTQSLMVEPTRWETAIEIPSRLTMSTAQDAVWRTDRRLPKEVLSGTPCEPVEAESWAPELENGKSVAGPCTTPTRHDLWSARLLTDNAAPGLRIVSSPDFRPMAIGAGLHRPPASKRDLKNGATQGAPLPGHSAPPRGPYAPWLIGPEQLESSTLKPEIFAKNGEDDVALCKPPAAGQADQIWLIRWLCSRLEARKKITEDAHRLFRTTLDANDRHQLVMLSSAYGLPVVGKRMATGDNVEIGGALVKASGQFEPGENFAILDASNDQAVYRPVPLDVRELSLTALGGSFWHDTSFKPAAGAEDYWGRKLFDGFSIERWQQDIVLGRDIRGEVVYKGYLFPLGHRASMIKLTERVFLKTPTQGVKTLLRQRIFLRVGIPEKAYPAVGQPHRGRLWCAGTVTMLTTRTPDIMDPSFPLGSEPSGAEAALNGRINLENGPGLAFWPRTDITEQGRVIFQFRLDDAVTSLPLIFVDNIAATTAASLKIVSEHYAKQAEALRTMTLGDQKVRYAQETRSGDASYPTASVVVLGHGRLAEQTASWTGDLTGYSTTGVLEGAEQPPFYPRVETARVRLTQVERFSSGAPALVEAQYDGHYVRHGFTPPDQQAGAGGAPSRPANPVEIFLNLRSVLKLSMGESGDRSAGIGRPNSKYIALSRLKGPVGGDDVISYQAASSGGPDDQPTPDNSISIDIGDNKPGLCKATPPCKTAPSDCVAETSSSALLICEEKRLELVSLAAHFDRFRTQAESAKSAPGASKLVTVVGPASRPPAPAAAGVANDVESLTQTLNILQGVFSGDAKVLGAIRLKDLLVLLGLPTPAEAMPGLKETIDRGTAALRGVGAALADILNDVRTRVLLPLRNAVGRLRGEWLALDAKLTKALGDVSFGATEQRPSIDTAFPGVSQGLEALETSLTAALAEEDPLALAPKLAEVFEAGRTLFNELGQIAANPVERLKDAVGAEFQKRLATFGADLNALKGFLPKLRAFAETLKADLVEKLAESIVDALSEGELARQFAFTFAPPSTLAIADSVTRPPFQGPARAVLKKVDDALIAAFAPLTKSDFQESDRRSSRRHAEGSGREGHDR